MSKELDYMEYADDSAAQSAYPTSEEKGAEASIDSITTGQNTDGWIYGAPQEWVKWGEKFTLSNKYYITKVEVYVKKVGNPTDNTVLRIETDNAGLPSNNLADANATKSLASSGFGAAYGWQTFSFATPFWLDPGTYHIVLERDGAGSTANYSSWGRNTSAPRSDGSYYYSDNNWYETAADLLFNIYGQKLHLQCYSEASIKQQGSYSLKGFAEQTDSLNDYLERTIGTPIDLSGYGKIKFDIRASRTGSNIKIGIHDSGGTWTEITPNITSGDTWQNVEWDISGVSDVNKDAIDKIKITIVNADADNTFYIDNMYAEEAEGGDAIFFGMNF